MKENYMPFPAASEEWKLKALAFALKWDYPHCIGAIDGKHVVNEVPANRGSLYYNYKHIFPVVLMALVDAECKFVYADIGGYGKQSDGGVFAASLLGRAFKSHISSLQLPGDEIFEEAEEIGPFPYVIVADEAFPI